MVYYYPVDSPVVGSKESVEHSLFYTCTKVGPEGLRSLEMRCDHVFTSLSIPRVHSIKQMGCYNLGAGAPVINFSGTDQRNRIR
ncbi:hypothetical protein BHE74_00027367 [Ensete ventricosum]|nr:hypothetical protein BHE74_00027367 [Ensete ventricosum]